MKKFIWSLSAAVGLAVAAPALAQDDNRSTDQAWTGAEIRARIGQLDSRLAAGDAAGEISRAEQRNLRARLNDLRRLERAYRSNGLTRPERAYLQSRIIAARDEIRDADNGRFDDDNRYSWLERDRGAYAGVDFRDRIYRLQLRLDAGLRSGDISGAEEARIRRQLAGLRDLERQYRRNGLTGAERRDLQQRVRYTRDQIRVADRYRFDNDERYSWWEPDESRGQGGPLEAVDACEDRGTLASIVNQLFGRPCLRVGEVAERNLYGLPYRYRDDFRDTAAVYHRYDGDLIYAINARTGRVVSSWDVQ